MAQVTLTSGQVTDTPLLSLHAVTKSFGGARALDRVDFGVHAGEVHALAGMNGAGKSTLIKVLSGAITPDSGHVELSGADAGRLTPHRARAAGIRTVHQRRTLVGPLSVAENLVLGRLPATGPLVNWRRIATTARTRLDALGLDIDPRVPADRLSPAEQTMVEIAREVGAGGQVLILDEPTASLGPREAHLVHDLVRTLRADGLAIVYISHHLDEVLGLADRVTVLRDGAVALRTDADAADMRALVLAMAGDEVRDERTRTHAPGAEVLRLRGVHMRGRLEPFDLAVHEREVVAVLGPAGDGQTQLFPVLSGSGAPHAGTVDVAGKTVTAGSVHAALAAGLRCVTGDRLRAGLVPQLGVDENVEMAQRSLSRRGLVRWRGLRDWAAVARKAYGVRTLAPDPPVQALSGGNQQKVLLAKWFATAGKCYLLEEPTSGVDVAAKAEIHRLVDEHVTAGAAVVLASSDVDEVLRLADRVVVIRSGKVVADHPVAEVTRADLVAITVGVGGAA